MYKLLKVLGILSFTFGSIATVLCFFPKGIFLAIFAGFLGMVCSSAYLLVDFRYQLSTQKHTPALIGIALSSVPILLILIVNFFHH